MSSLCDSNWREIIPALWFWEVTFNFTKGLESCGQSYLGWGYSGLILAPLCLTVAHSAQVQPILATGQKRLSICRSCLRGELRSPWTVLMKRLGSFSFSFFAISGHSSSIPSSVFGVQRHLVRQLLSESGAVALGQVWDQNIEVLSDCQPSAWPHSYI